MTDKKIDQVTQDEETQKRSKPIYAKDMIKNLETYKKNIIDLYRKATKKEILLGQSWYTIANDIAVTLAENNKLSLSQVAGVIAALSPQVKWAQNLLDASNVILFEDEAKPTTYGRNFEKALSILWKENTPDQVLGKLKTLCFYLNILTPDNKTRVTIDRHATRAAVNPLLTADEAIFYANTPKKYDILERAYTEASQDLDLLPHQLQAIVWETFRRVYVEKRYGGGKENYSDIPAFM